MIYLVELTGYTDASTSAVYRYATGAYVTQPGDTPASTWYDPRVIDPGTITRTLIDTSSAEARSNPRAEVGYGYIRLANIDGALDALFGGGAVSFRERAVRVLQVEEGAAYSTAEVLLVATISQAQMTDDEVVVGLKDRLYELDSPHQTVTYAGTNSLPAGVEGVEDLAGKPKPLLYGKAFALPAPCVNTTRLIYQVSARALQSVDGVYDGGSPYTAGSTYSSQSDMEATAPSAGQYRAWLAGGMIRLGTAPTLALTVDATGDTASNSTAAQLLRTLALARGIDAGDIDSADVAALDALNAAVLGVWIADDRTTLDVMDEVARSVGAVYRFDRLGRLRMQRLDAPSGTPVASLAAWNVASVQQVQSGEDVPVGTVRLRYARYYRTQRGGDVAGSVSAADGADLGQEWRVAEYTAAPSPNPHRRLQTLERDTALTTTAAASAEAQRLHGLVSAVRRTHTLTGVQLDDAVTSIDVGAVVGLRWPRYGFNTDTETPRLVVGITSYLRDRRCDLTLWG